MTTNPVKGRCGTCDWPTNTLPCPHCEERNRQRRALSRGVCPHSGLPLSKDIVGDQRLYCAVCDCFGFDPEQEDDCG